MQPGLIWPPAFLTSFLLSLPSLEILEDTMVDYVFLGNFLPLQSHINRQISCESGQMRAGVGQEGVMGLRALGIYSTNSYMEWKICSYTIKIILASSALPKLS